MVEFSYVITDELGIHARPAGDFVKLAKTFTSAITISKNGKTADAKRLLAVMGLGIKQGQQAIVKCTGDDEQKAASELESFFKKNL
jgi:phosphocarrier protein HPr